MVAEVARALLLLLPFASVFASTVSSAPTLAPTFAPSVVPTNSPSSAPSLAPSSTPSVAPTYSPSALPTPTPSNAPSAFPTSAPTSSEQLCARSLTYSQIAEIIANDNTSCPVIIRDYTLQKKVYEMSSFGYYHAHGKNDIYMFCGKDMTKVFEEGPHRYQPFQGSRGRVMESLNRSAVFTCLGTFMESTPIPPPTKPPSPAVNATVYPCLTKGKEFQLRKLVLDKFRAIAITKDNRERAAFNGGLVRLAFHDATTYSKISNDGGPDGFVNLNDVDNKGLKKHIDFLEELWESNRDRISRADFWYLAAVTVIENAGGPKVNFRYGRKDCPSPEACEKNNDIGRLPRPDMDWFYIRGFFNYALGMTDREITALFGAHVLGRAHPENSGFDGPWVSGPSPGMLFSNQFYLGLQTVEWVKEVHSFPGFPNRQQWNQGGVGTGFQMFLTSDIALLVTNPDDPTCTNSLLDMSVASAATAKPKDTDCHKNNVTFSIVDEYSRSQANFFRDFAAAFQKLCELGYDEGTLISTGTCFPGAQTFPNDPPPPTTVSGASAAQHISCFFVLSLILSSLY